MEGKATKIQGIKKLVFRDFPDNRFETVPLLEIVKALEKVKGDVKPDIIFTHYQGDLNIHHQIDFKGVLTAYLPMMGEISKKI